MNREQAKTLLPIIQAFAEGKEIQYISKISPERGWIDYKYSPFTQQVEWSIFNHNPHYYQWRIKPEKKTGWIVIFKRGSNNTYTVRQHKEDITQMYNHNDIEAVIPITYEEGEGL
jgi:hypothetical protein